MTLREVAASAELTEATIGRIERGTYTPPDRTLTRVLRALARVDPFSDSELHAILASYGYLPPDTARRFDRTDGAVFTLNDRTRLAEMGLLRSSAEEVAESLKTTASAVVAEHLARERESRAARATLPDRESAPADYAAALPHHLLDRLIESVGEVRAAHALRHLLGIMGVGAGANTQGAAVLKLALPPMPRDDIVPGATEQITTYADPATGKPTHRVREINPPDPDAPRPLERAEPPDADRKSG